MRSERRYDLDWLRVGAFSLLIVYHTGMLFVSWDWHIKDPARSEFLEYLMIFINQWRLPLLFVISGIGVSFNLKKHQLSEFVRERSSRLLIPLITGILIVIPPQVYIERIYKGSFHGSYISFYPHFFNGLYPSGNFSWHHLWFIVYLYVFCILALPLFWLHSSNQRLNTSLKTSLSNPTVISLLFLPVAVSEALLRSDWPSTHNLFADWANLTSYFILFLTGFVMSTHQTTWEVIVRFRAMWLIAAVALFLFMLFGFRMRLESLTFFELIVYRIVRSANSWAWILTLFGYSKFYLNHKSVFIDYANRAVYPFYILHQTFIVLLGYLLLNFNMNVFIKLALIASFTFCLTAFLYVFVISRYQKVGILFGLKGKA